MAQGQISAEEGSSPLTRGKQGPVWPEGQPGGLIPAHAGKTLYFAGTTISITAHPRSRGENLNAADDGVVCGGSSPLTRGKPKQPHFKIKAKRLIPAHAGKTHGHRPRPHRTEAHPRSRGENMQAAMTTTRDNGSSPLTRGKPDGRILGEGHARLIPAHAGKTATRRPSRSRARAHPRSRGENFISLRRSSAVCGSSPLTRGKPLAYKRKHEFHGLIPAHAGKTSSMVVDLSV